MKKLCMWILALCVMMCTPSLVTNAANVTGETNKVGATTTVGGCKITYEAEDSTYATITGVEGSGDLDLSNGINGYKIIAIGEGAFEGSNVHSVVLPSTVESIGIYAFSECVYLTSINIPEGVTELGECAFWGDIALTSITLPSTLTTIGEMAFYQVGYTKSVSLTLPKALKSIAEDAFKYCPYLTLSVYSGSYAETWCKSVYGTTNHSNYYGWKYTVIGTSTTEDTTESTTCTSHSYTTTITKKADATNKTKGTYKKVCSKCGNTTSGTINYPSALKLSATSYTYTGSTRKPTVTVYDTAGKTIATSHYTVTYPSSSVNPGTYTVKVTFNKGQYYTGYLTAKYTIGKYPMSKATISGIANKVYTGSAIKQSIVVKYGSTTLKNGTHYTVTYSNNTNVGIAKVTITGKGNYSGSVTKTFNIVPKQTTGVKQTTPYALTGIKVAWNKVAQASGYQVYYSTSKNGTYVYAGRTTSNYLIKSGLKAGSNYYFKVRAYKTSGSKVYYGAFSTAALGVTNVAAPTVKLAAGASAVKATWNSVPGAYGYEVYMAVRSNSNYMKITTVKASTLYAVKKNLNRNTVFYVRVRALRKNAQGQFIYGAFSQPVAVKTK